MVDPAVAKVGNIQCVVGPEDIRVVAAIRVYLLLDNRQQGLTVLAFGMNAFKTFPPRFIKSKTATSPAAPCRRLPLRTPLKWLSFASTSP